MAKMAREQAVREKRARKLEKKEYKKQAAAAGLVEEPGVEGELSADGDEEPEQSADQQSADQPSVE